MLAGEQIDEFLVQLEVDFTGRHKDGTARMGGRNVVEINVGHLGGLIKLGSEESEPRIRRVALLSSLYLKRR